MKKMVKRFVQSCDVCARSKASRHSPYGLLEPLPVPPRAWSSVSLDFIVDLPVSGGKTCILVFVDRLTKMAHFVGLAAVPSAEETADAFLVCVFRAHGLPDELVSDRGSQFTSRFWSRLTDLLGIQRNLSTAFHPESDGQTEIVNQRLEQYLRCYVGYQQDDWCSLLPLAEFAYNNSLHSSTKMSPFFANYGFHPRCDFTTPTRSVVPRAEFRARSFKDVLDFLVLEALEMSRLNMAEQANKSRLPPPVFTVGQLVWLNAKNIRTVQPCKKLGPKKLGPFKILAMVGSRAVRLELPSSLAIHPVFHVSLLEPYVDGGRLQPPPPPPVVVGSDVEYEVEKILDSRRRYRKLQYLVRWLGYGMDSDTWEPAENLAGCAELVNDFHVAYPMKPR